MKARNRMIQGTVGYGDCGLDLMCMMLGIPQQQKVRDDLRIELRNFLILHAHEPWMWTLMCACGELDASDIDALQ